MSGVSGCMQPNWPLAYPGIPLEKHLILVTEVALELFNEDLIILSRRLRRGSLAFQDLNLRSLLTASTLLHDVGKASNYYRELERRTGRLSFYMHEIAWSLIMYSIARRMLENGLVHMYDYVELIAKVVSRHHAAMECRHPVDLTRDYCSQRLEDVRKVIEGLSVDLVIEVLGRLRRMAASFEVPKDLWGVLTDRSTLREVIEEAKRNLRYDVVSLASIHDDYVVVASLSGMLVVSDIVTASFFECRTSDDGLAPAYALHWRSELFKKLLRLSGRAHMCRHISDNHL